MTREEIKNQLLNEIDKSVKKYGGLDEIMCRAPQIGKNSWTWREVCWLAKKGLLKRGNNESK